MTRRALIVGIDDYPNQPLTGCVADALEMYELLRRNDDGDSNFDCELLISPRPLHMPGESQKITLPRLREYVKSLFEQPADVALFYFAGHGDRETGSLVAQDEGLLDLTHLLNWANTASKIGEVIIILDSCFAGGIGHSPIFIESLATLREGVSVLTASRDTQIAQESEGRGVFTRLVTEALEGGAADLLGNVTVASVYAYADLALGAWDQRPILKTHVSRWISLRKCQPHIDAQILRKLPDYFPDPTADMPLDPSYDPELEPRNAAHEEIFTHLKRLRDVHLVVPVGAEYLYHAAFHSKSCRLTPVGRCYWGLAKAGRI